MRRITGAVLPPAVAFLLLFGSWEWAVRAFHVKRIILPRPSAILAGLWQEPQFWAHHALATTTEAALGFGLAAAVAGLLAVGIVHIRPIEAALVPVITMVQVTPIIALAPPLVIWLGFGLAPKVLMAALVCVVPFVVNAVTGLRAIDPDTMELLHSVNASRLEIFTRLRMPHALPYLLGAARVGVGLSLVGALVAEWSAGSSQGLGWVMVRAQNSFATTRVWGAVLTLTLLGCTGVVFVGAIERRLLRWQPSTARR